MLKIFFGIFFVSSLIFITYLTFNTLDVEETTTTNSYKNDKANDQINKIMKY